MEKEHLYLMCPGIQEKEITKFCFGECKKIQMGIVELDTIPFVYCFEKECKHTHKSEYLGVNYIKGDEVEITVRKLKE